MWNIFSNSIWNCSRSKDVIWVGSPSMWPGTHLYLQCSRNVATCTSDHLRMWSDLKCVFKTSWMHSHLYSRAVHLWSYHSRQTLISGLKAVFNAPTVFINLLPVQLNPFITPSNIPLVVLWNMSSWVEFSSKTWSKTNIRSLLALLLMFLFRDMSCSLGSKMSVRWSTTWTTFRQFSRFSLSLVGLTRMTTLTWLHTSLAILVTLNQLQCCCGRSKTKA